MNPLRVRVTPLGNGYVAESQMPEFTAIGSSAEEAAENARLMAMEIFDTIRAAAYPSMLIVRIDEPHKSAIAMQPMNMPFSLSAAEKDFRSCYVDSAGDDAAPNVQEPRTSR